MPILKNLVISGGGTNGIGFIGILKYLSEKNLFKNIEHYIGTSAGAMLCYFLSIGFNWRELYEFAYHFNFTKLINDINLDSFLEKFGFEDTSKLFYILKRLSESKNISPDITFKEHYEKTKIKLTITGTCISNYKLYYFNYETYPDMKILLALRISACIPLVFTPIIFEDKLWVDRKSVV